MRREDEKNNEEKICSRDARLAFVHVVVSSYNDVRHIRRRQTI